MCWEAAAIRPRTQPPPLRAATHSITVVYAGDTNFSTSTSSPLSQMVTSASVATTTAVGASASTVNYDQALTFTAAVSATSGSNTPTGSIDFYDTTISTNLGSVSLSSGKVTLTTSSLPVGTQIITASYTPTGLFSAPAPRLRSR